MLFGLAILLYGLGYLGYYLVAAAKLFVQKQAWFSLFLLFGGAVFTAALLWASSLVARLILLMGLASAAYFLSPLWDRLLS